MEEKRKRLEQWMSMHADHDICVAFSAGVDSSLILKLACEAAKRTGHTVYAATFSTRLHPKADLAEAKQAAARMGAEHLVLEVDESSQDAIMNNPVNRCYLCKKYLFTELKAAAARVGAAYIMEGTNADDLNVYRPGIAAVRELGILSPLSELGITKAEVRALAAALDISAASRPSSPCLITRIPYNTRVDFDILEKLGQGEEFLRGLGFRNVRLRLHGDVLRLEIDRQSFKTLFEQTETVVSYMKELGFPYVTLDLEGFRSGSMDIGIRDKTETSGKGNPGKRRNADGRKRTCDDYGAPADPA